MIKMYVMKTCPYCEYVEKQVENNDQFKIIDIGAHVKNLKEFLDLREHNSAFDEAKKIDVKVSFKQFCIRKWAMERKIDLSSYKDSEITNNDFLKIGRKAVDDNKLQNDKERFGPNGPSLFDF